MLKIKDLCFEYEDGKVALKNINIDGENGNVIGIIGANGTGKSTLFMNIMGILKAKSGSIEFDGKKLTYDKKSLREYRKKVNIVFQNPEQQLFYSDVYDDIAFALRNLNFTEKDIEKRVYDSLDRVNSLDLIKKPIHFLSYGQKKRVSIAGILALDGKILLMDEPTSGLDPEMTKDMKNIINEIKNDRQVIISSHDMDLIYEICDYIYVIKDGEVTAHGKPEDVFIQTKVLAEARLDKPWLIKIYEKFNTPLFKSEEEFINYNK